MVERVESAALECRGEPLLVAGAQAQRDRLRPAPGALQRRGGAVEDDAAALGREALQPALDAAARRLVERVAAVVRGEDEPALAQALDQRGLALERGCHAGVEPRGAGELAHAVEVVVAALPQRGVHQAVVDVIGVGRKIEPAGRQRDAQRQRPAAGALVERRRAVGRERDTGALERGADLVRPHAQLGRLERQRGDAAREPARNRQPRRVAVGDDPADPGRRPLDQGAQKRRAASGAAEMVQLVEHDRRRDPREVLARPLQRRRVTVVALGLQRGVAGRARHRRPQRRERRGQPAHQLAGVRVVRGRGERQVRDRAGGQVIADQRRLAEPFVRDDESDARSASLVQAREKAHARERACAGYRWDMLTVGVVRERVHRRPHGHASC